MVAARSALVSTGTTIPTWSAAGGWGVTPRRARALVVAILVGAVALGCAAALSLSVAVSSRQAAAPAGPVALPAIAASLGAADRPLTLPPALAAAASAGIGAHERAFWATRAGGALVTRGGGIRSSFTASGARLAVPGGALDLAPVAVGRAGQSGGVAWAGGSSAAVLVHVAAANDVAYRDGAVTESYHAGPFGLEQTFTVPRRPFGHSGSLVLATPLHSDLLPQASASQILFRNSSGAVALRLGQLHAFDATGRPLPAAFALRGHTLVVRVDDRGARYPLTIDPFFLQQGPKLTATGEHGAGLFGYSVALSSNGSTALIGAVTDEGQHGAAYVFTRTGATWTQQARLTTTEVSEEAELGVSVALAANGSTALVGAFRDDNAGGTEHGAAVVFTRSGTTWTQQGAPLLATGESEHGQFGNAVALSANGSTALIGSYFDQPEGSAFVFTRIGTVWKQQGLRLLPPAGEGGEFGYSVALSSTGSTALLGAPNAGGGTGAAHVFVRSGTAWSHQAALTGAGEVGAGRLGSSVALAGNGNTALVGAPDDESRTGSAFAYTRSGTTWAQRQRILATGESGEGFFGTSVALSGEGTTALVGASSDAGGGSAYLFAHPGSSWVQQQQLHGEGETGTPLFGFSVALSSTATTALVGGHTDNEEAGAAWVFVPSKYPVLVLHRVAGPVLVKPNEPVEEVGPWQLVFAQGTIDCQQSALGGTLTTNAQHTDSFSIVHASFAGPGGSACTSTSPLGSTVALSANLAPGLPSYKGTLDTANGTSALKGAPDIKLTAVFQEGSAPPTSCTWQAATLGGTFATGSVPLVVQNANQALALVKGVSGAACPASAALDATSTFSAIEPTGGQAPIYMEG